MSSIENYRIKQYLKKLKNLKGIAPTGCITVQIRPGEQISDHLKILNNEYSISSSIKSHTTVLAVQSSITSVMAKLKTYNNKTPPNGLIVYCGEAFDESLNDKKEKKYCIAIEPPKVVSRKNYICDNRFDTSELEKMITDDKTFGFLVIDGNGALFATISGSKTTVLHKFTVELPKKHGKGGQSAQRFARLRLEKRQHYLRKVAEITKEKFIGTNNIPIINGLIIAGSAELKYDLIKDDLFDQRLKTKYKDKDKQKSEYIYNGIMKYIDVAYGFEQGLKQAIELSKDVLSDLDYIKEKNIVNNFFSFIQADSNEELYFIGIKDMMNVINNTSAINTIIVWEDLPHILYVVTSTNNEETIYICEERQENAVEKLAKYDNNVNYKIESLKLVDYLIDLSEIKKEETNEMIKVFNLNIITNKTPEGKQFQVGFKGLGGTLNYSIYHYNVDNNDENICNEIEEYNNCLNDIDFM